jgi:hypothetical protein
VLWPSDVPSDALAWPWPPAVWAWSSHARIGGQRECAPSNEFLWAHQLAFPNRKYKVKNDDEDMEDACAWTHQVIRHVSSSKIFNLETFKFCSSLYVIYMRHGNVA